MRKIKIITDSTADMSDELAKELGVVKMPLYVSFGENTYRDGVDIDTNKLYELVDEYGELPKTSAISPGDFIKEFKKWIDEDYDIIYTGIGADMSGTFQSALIAATEFPEDRIHLVNSANLSSGIALLVLKAVDMVNEGLSAKEIKEKLEDIVPRVRSQFAIRVLDYLHKGGRATGTQALLGKMLRMRPIIKVTDGKMHVDKKPMGTMTKAVNIQLEEFIEEYNKGNVDKDYLMITHSIAPKQAIQMHEFIEKNAPDMNKIIESYAGCVISSHCGSGTIGILYIVNE